MTVQLFAHSPDSAASELIWKLKSRSIDWPCFLASAISITVFWSSRRPKQQQQRWGSEIAVPGAARSFCSAQSSNVYVRIRFSMSLEPSWAIWPTLLFRSDRFSQLVQPIWS